jgi:hypothetical protein
MSPPSRPPLHGKRRHSIPLCELAEYVPSFRCRPVNTDVELLFLFSYSCRCCYTRLSRLLFLFCEICPSLRMQLVASLNVNQNVQGSTPLPYTPLTPTPSWAKAKWGHTPISLFVFVVIIDLYTLYLFLLLFFLLLIVDRLTKDWIPKIFILIKIFSNQNYL